jgi:predicted RNase H-like HicB family nuclease
MEVYAVVWGTGSYDDHYNAHSFCGVHGVYKSEESARKALEECKDETLYDVYHLLDQDEELPSTKEDVQVYGSVESGYFKICYTLGTEPVEVYIQIQYTFVQD